MKQGKYTLTGTNESFISTKESSSTVKLIFVTFSVAHTNRLKPRQCLHLTCIIPRQIFTPFPLHRSFRNHSESLRIVTNSIRSIGGSFVFSHGCRYSNQSRVVLPAAACPRVNRSSLVLLLTRRDWRVSSAVNPRVC